MRVYLIDFLKVCAQPTTALLNHDNHGREIPFKDNEFVKVTRRRSKTKVANMSGDWSVRNEESQGSGGEGPSRTSTPRRAPGGRTFPRPRRSQDVHFIRGRG